MPKILRAVKANPGIRAAYRRRLEKLIDEMNASVLWWIRAAYREREDEIVPEPVAADAEIWRTASNGKHYQVETETGEIVSGNIGQKGFQPGFRPLESAAPDMDLFNTLLDRNEGSSIKAAHEYFKEKLQGRFVTVQTQDGPMDVHFTGGSWTELKKDMRKDSLKASLVPMIPDIVLTGTHEVTAPVHEHQIILGFNTFSKQVQTTAGLLNVLVDVAFRPQADPQNIVYSLVREGSYPYTLRKPGKKTTDSSCCAFRVSRIMSRNVGLDASLDGIFEVVNIRVIPVRGGLDSGDAKRPTSQAMSAGRNRLMRKDIGLEKDLSVSRGSVNQKIVAADASPARFLQRTLARLFRYWTNRWDDEAQKIAESFVNSASRKTRASYLQAFRDSGFTVKADPSRILNNTVQALIGENVALIKTIPQQLFGDLTQMVQRSIAEGRDVPALEAEIMDRCGKTKKRAAVIARDQTNKAAEAVKRAENQRLGITEGIWVHVPGRKYARKSHMEFNGKKFKLDEGLYDRNEGKKVRPGECINCCCTYRPIVPGFGE